jgi:hypothetical protein
MHGFEPMTLTNMRANGVRSIIAACANCGGSADVNVDLLAGDPDSPRGRQPPPMQQLWRQHDLDSTGLAHEPTAGRS